MAQVGCLLALTLAAVGCNQPGRNGAAGSESSSSAAAAPHGSDRPVGPVDESSAARTHSGGPGGAAESSSDGPRGASGAGIVNPPGGVFDSRYVPAAPGKYAEQVSGTYTLDGRSVTIHSSGLLDVLPAATGEVQSWEQYSAANQPPDTLAVLFNRTGMALYSESLSLGSHPVTCTYAPALPILPTRTVFGNRFTSTVSCGTFRAHVTGSMLPGTTISLEGIDYATLCVQATITTEGATPATVVEADWVSPTLRMVLKSTEATTTTYAGQPYHVATTTMLTTRPA